MMDNANKSRCLSLAVTLAERRALAAHGRFKWLRGCVRDAKAQGKRDLARVHTLEAWRERAAFNAAREDRRQALEMFKEINRTARPIAIDMPAEPA